VLFIKRKYSGRYTNNAINWNQNTK